MMLNYYSAAAYGPRWSAPAGVTIGGAIWIYAGFITPGSAMAAVIAEGIAIPLVVWRVGHGARQLAVSNQRLAQAAEELRRGQADLARRVVVDERVRIAREPPADSCSRYTRSGTPVSVPEALGTLTGRELEVLRLVATGRSNADIAADLTLGEATVKTHLNRVMTKLGLSSRAQAVVIAYESGLVVPGVSPPPPPL